MNYLFAEIIISAIYVAYMAHLWSGIYNYVGNVIGTIIFALGVGYIIAVCFTRKLSKMHKIAFIIFCILLILIGYQNKHEMQIIEQSIKKEMVIENNIVSDKRRLPKTLMEKELKDNLIEFDQTTQKYDTTDITIERLEKDMQSLTDGLIKTMAQEILSHSKNINVPDSMLSNPDFLNSKEKLAVAISKQDADIKRYKEEVNAVVDNMMIGAIDSFMSECIKKYTNVECNKINEPFKLKMTEARDKIYKVVPLYIDYLKEELNTMRFIKNNYDKFTTSGKYPHFIDNNLQNNFITKVQEIDRKGQIVDEFRNNALQNLHNVISNI